MTNTGSYNISVDEQKEATAIINKEIKTKGFLKKNNMLRYKEKLSS